MKLRKFRELIEPYNPCSTSRAWLNNRDQDEELSVTFDALKRLNKYDYNLWVNNWVRPRVNHVTDGSAPSYSKLVRVPGVGYIDSCELERAGHHMLLRFFDEQPGEKKEPPKLKAKALSNKFLGKHLYHWLEANNCDPCVDGRAFMRLNAEKSLKHVLKTASDSNMTWLLERLEMKDFVIVDGDLYGLDDDQRLELITDFFASIDVPKSKHFDEADVKMTVLMNCVDENPSYFSPDSRELFEAGLKWLNSWTDDSDLSEVLKAARTYDELQAIAVVFAADFPTKSTYRQMSSHFKSKRLEELRAQLLETGIAIVNDAW